MRHRDLALLVGEKPYILVGEYVVVDMMAPWAERAKAADLIAPKETVAPRETLERDVVPICPDCDEPGKCKVLGCGSAALLRAEFGAGWTPKDFSRRLGTDARLRVLEREVARLREELLPSIR